MRKHRTLKFHNLKDIASQRIFGLAVRLLQTRGELNGISACHVTMPPGSVHPAVYHKGRDELVFVIGGGGRMKAGRISRRLTTGDIAFIPAKCVHKVDAGRKGLRVLSIFAPAMPKNPDIVLVK